MNWTEFKQVMTGAFLEAIIDLSKNFSSHVQKSEENLRRKIIEVKTEETKAQAEKSE